MSQNVWRGRLTSLHVVASIKLSNPGALGMHPYHTHLTDRDQIFAYSVHNFLANGMALVKLLNDELSFKNKSLKE